MDYFAFLDLPRKLAVDAAALDARYRALSRQFHPDYFQGASAAERRESVEKTAYLNDAYRTLRDETSRIEYLLTLEGAAAPSEPDTVSAALLEEVFALNEEIDEIRSTTAEHRTVRLERVRGEVERMHAVHAADLKRLAAEWDALAEVNGDGERRQTIVTALRERMLERRYIVNLREAVERATIS